MNYVGYKKFCVDVVEVVNIMCDFWVRLNDMEYCCCFDFDVFVECLVCQMLYCVNCLFMEVYIEILELDVCFKD